MHLVYSFFSVSPLLPAVRTLCLPPVCAPISVTSKLGGEQVLWVESVLRFWTGLLPGTRVTPVSSPPFTQSALQITAKCSPPWPFSESAFSFGDQKFPKGTQLDSSDPFLRKQEEID